MCWTPLRFKIEISLPSANPCSNPIINNTASPNRNSCLVALEYANTSLAFYTAHRFKYQNIGKVIGQETGGNLNDINGGQIIFLTLPNSGIEVDFPVMGGFSTSSQPNTGVMPHIMLEYKMEDVIGKVDLEVQKALELIRN